MCGGKVEKVRELVLKNKAFRRPKTFVIDGIGAVAWVNSHRFLRDVAVARINVGLEVEPGWDQRFLEEFRKAEPDMVSTKSWIEGLRPPNAMNAIGFIERWNQWRKDGGVLADSAVAYQRAKVCRDCPLHIAGVRCGMCQAAIQKMMKLVTVMPDMKYCAVCGCHMGIKVYGTGAIIETQDPEEQPDNCWIRIERELASAQQSGGELLVELEEQAVDAQ